MPPSLKCEFDAKTAKQFFCHSSHLVEELPQGLVALALVADLGDRDAAGAGVDVGRAILLARVVEVAGFGGVQAVVLLGGCRFRCKIKGLLSVCVF